MAKNKLKNRPVLAIGIEVGSYGWLEKKISEGYFPNLGALASKGTLSQLQTVSDISSGCIWPTFYTGVNPLKNGQFFTHMQLIGGTYRIDKKYANDVPFKPFWAPLGETGKRVFAFDIAQTCPVENLNGIQLSAWGSEYPAWPRSSWPKSLMNELVSKYGSHPLVDQYRLSIAPKNEEEYKIFYEKLVTGLQRKARICLDMLERETWDMFLVVFPETHWAMHILWQTFDPKHPNYKANITLPFQDIFLDLYNKLDQYIGQFIQKMPEATVLIFSGSGMGPNYSGWHLLPEVLEKLGYSKNDKQSYSWLPMKKWGTQKIRKIEDTISLNIIEFLRATLPRRLWDKWTRKILFSGNPWKESKAFCLPNDYSGAIRINLINREPNGVVSPGEEYESLCEDLIHELEALINPVTGANAIEKVIRLDKTFPGETLGGFPDLIIKWASDVPINSLHSPRLGTVAGKFPERRTGAHRDDPFLISSHKINPNASPHIVDIAPSIFYLLNSPIPEYFDGRSFLL